MAFEPPHSGNSWRWLCLSCGADGVTTETWVETKLADPAWGQCFCGERNEFVLEKRLEEA